MPPRSVDDLSPLPAVRCNDDMTEYDDDDAKSRPCPASASSSGSPLYSMTTRNHHRGRYRENEDLLRIAAAELQAMRCHSSPRRSYRSHSPMHPPVIAADAAPPSPPPFQPFPVGCLALLSSLPGNRRCMDCDSPTRIDSSWAAVRHGAVLCLECSGIHRGLGVRTSKVKSLAMDGWTRPEVLAMLEGGNAQLADFFNRHRMGRNDPLLHLPPSGGGNGNGGGTGGGRGSSRRSRYETRAAYFYRTHLGKHAAELDDGEGRYRGREASRRSSESLLSYRRSSSPSSEGRSPPRRQQPPPRIRLKEATAPTSNPAIQYVSCIN